MKRIIGGWVVWTLAALNAFEAIYDGGVFGEYFFGIPFARGMIGSLILFLLGLALVRSGRRELLVASLVESMSLQMLREKSRISASEIAGRVVRSEGDVRRMIAKSQAEGAIPRDAAIG